MWKTKKRAFLLWLTINCIRLLFKTLRCEKCICPPAPAIILSWHEDLVIGAPAFAFADNVLLLSASKDGELYWHLLRKLGWKAVRGSSNRQGVLALKQMIKIAQTERIFICTDGPKGPRHKVKPGGVFVAQHTQNPIYAVRMCCPAWTLKQTWDKMLIPKPFGRVKAVFSGPLYIEKTTHLEEGVAKVQKLMDDLDAQLGKV